MTSYEENKKDLLDTNNVTHSNCISHASCSTSSCGCGHDHGENTAHTNCNSHSACATSSCGCGHDHLEKEGAQLKIFLARLLASIVLLALIEFTNIFSGFTLIFYIIAYLLAGFEVLTTAIKNISKGQVFDENFLMGIASLGAFVINEQTEAVAVMIFYGLGEILQNSAVNRSRKSIADLMDIRPEFASLKTENGTETVKPETVKVNNILIVRAGEKVPLDGVVVKGSSFLDTVALTGESVPRKANIGDDVLSGSINQEGLLEIRVTKNFKESTVSKILELVQNASTKKAKSEKFITKFARYYTPAVVLTAIPVALIPPLLGLGSFSDWLYRSLTFLIISCPCALVMSIPISFFGGIGGAARQGILIKGGNYLEALNTVDTLIFDKTGTLTKGIFEVQEIHVEQTALDRYSKDDLLALAAKAEFQSNHPIAKSILSAFGKTQENAEDIKEIAGQGMIAISHNGGEIIHVGNAKLMAQIGINNLPVFTQSIVYIAKNKEYLGYILIADTLKNNIKESLEKIRHEGIKKLIMLTGDNEIIAKDITQKLNLDDVHAELLPQDKVTILEKIMQENEQKAEQKNKGRTAFVGDGINDAPVLSRADIGFAMGGIGSDAAIEAADIVIMDDSVEKVATAFAIAKKTRIIVVQNIIFCLGVKAIVMAFAFVGLTSIWFAIFADVGVALLALLNATRAMFIKEKPHH